MRRFVLLLACVTALSACTGGADDASTGSDPSPSTPANAEASGPEATASPGEPRARLQAGTDSVDGMLVRLCRKKDCEQPGRPAMDTLKVTDQRLLLFVMSLTPERAEVEVRRYGRDKVIEAVAMRPGDLMAYEPSLKAGRYDVLLDASWAEQRAVWRFDVRVKDV